MEEQSSFLQAKPTPSGQHSHSQDALTVTSQIEGTLKASDDLTYWGGKEGNLSRVRHHNCQIGLLLEQASWMGTGKQHWDYFPTNTSYARPTLMYITQASSGNLGFKPQVPERTKRLPSAGWRFEEHRLLRHHSHRHIEL